MRVLYFDCQSGVAGNMIIGSFIDGGISLKELEKRIENGIGLKKYWKISSTKLERKLPATLLKTKTQKKFTSFQKMIDLVASSNLSDFVKTKTCETISLLQKCEAKVHGKVKKLEELGNLDTIIDIAGSFICLEMVKPELVISSPINIGSPAPVAAEIIKEKKIPVYSTTNMYELATPTGLATIGTMAEKFAELKESKIISAGFGAGDIQLPDRPNIMKMLLVEMKYSYKREKLLLLETNIDDMDPRVYPFIIEKSLSLGACDAWLNQIQMKKGRPGIKISVLIDPEKEEEILELLFNETTTLGVRIFPLERAAAEREYHKGYKVKILPSGKRISRIEFSEAKKIKSKSSEPLYKILEREK